MCLNCQCQSVWTNRNVTKMPNQKMILVQRPNYNFFKFRNLFKNSQIANSLTK